MSNLTENSTNQLSELKKDWLQLKTYKGIVLDSAKARYIRKYGFDISEKTEMQIDKMVNPIEKIEPATKENKENTTKDKTKTNEPTIDIKELQIKDLYKYKTSETIYEILDITKNEKNEIVSIKVISDTKKEWTLKTKRDLFAQIVKI